MDALIANARFHFHKQLFETNTLTLTTAGVASNATANPTFNHSSLIAVNAKAYNKKFLKPYSNLLRFQELFICDLFSRERINQN